MGEGYSHGVGRVIDVPCRSIEARDWRGLGPGSEKSTKKKILKTPKRSHQPIENKGRDPKK
jgi:hypothetical protein